MSAVGIMQGRLSPARNGRLQSFPVETWRDEFFRAREAGLACLEWVYERQTESDNPLRTDDGLAETQRLAKETGVAVWSVCADYYMTNRLIQSDGKLDAGGVEHLVWLVGRVGALPARHIVLPFVDASSLATPREREGLASLLEAVMPAAEAAGVELHLETDVPPADVVRLMGRSDHPLVRITYDIGNSAALDRDPVEELTALRPWLGSVHVKDRAVGGGSVPLGRGAVDFPTCVRLIREAGFAGEWILQAAREDGVSEVALAIRNRRFVEEHLAAAAGRLI
ncbi:MAG: hypothetical protein A3G88_04135 [Omnitrophica WOR_2 bacterium RIFCSPLOWO2_12_FULL_63_16]|nr:MAG: hypothetical protein A3G88_04135 [Omnitrophica WOR_2 bacterium RIFCSPLOWO2_12_FULL_63_16]